MDLVKSLKKSKSRLRPSIINSGITMCSHPEFRAYYRKDVKIYRDFNLCYKYLKKESSLLLMSWNVQMFTDIKGRNSLERVIETINSLKPDILFLQEVPCSGLSRLSKKTGMEIQSFFRNYSFSREDEPISYLTITLTKPQVKVIRNLKKTFNNNYGEETRGYAFTQIVFKETIINLVNLHLDPLDTSGKTRLSQITDIFFDFDRFSRPLILGGDFNALYQDDYDRDHWDWLLKNSYLDLEPQSKTYMGLPSKSIHFIKARGFIDALSKQTYPAVYTCWTARRVDYFFHTPNIDLVQSSVNFNDISDHFPILTVLNEVNL